jgi:hypothetical protein
MACKQRGRLMIRAQSQYLNRGGQARVVKNLPFATGCRLEPVPSQVPYRHPLKIPLREV